MGWEYANGSKAVGAPSAKSCFEHFFVRTRSWRQKSCSQLKISLVDRQKCFGIVHSMIFYPFEILALFCDYKDLVGPSEARLRLFLLHPVPLTVMSLNKLGQQVLKKKIGTNS